jgi:hypothetical protein
MSKLDPRIAMTDGAKAAAAMAKIGLLRKTDSAAIDAVVKMLTTMIVEAAVQCGRGLTACATRRGWWLTTTTGRRMAGRSWSMRCTSSPR